MTDVTVEVLVETGTFEGGWTFAAEAEAVGETIDELSASALCAARTLWDEAYNNIGGCRRRVSITTHGEDGGSHTIRTEQRP